MSYTPKALVPQQWVDSTSTLKYTSPASGKGTYIDKATFTNMAATTLTLTVNLVPAGEIVGSKHTVISGQSISTNQTVSLSDLAGRYMAPGDMLYWTTTAATSINGAILGREVT